MAVGVGTSRIASVGPTRSKANRAWTTLLTWTASLAQAGGVFEQARLELRAGRKRSHWMWFIFPQHRDLGRSATVKYYRVERNRTKRAPITDAPAARRTPAQLLQGHPAARLRNEPADAILGPIDALKLRSSLEILARQHPTRPCSKKSSPRSASSPDQSSIWPPSTPGSATATQWNRGPGFGRLDRPQRSAVRPAADRAASSW